MAKYSSSSGTGCMALEVLQNSLFHNLGLSEALLDTLYRDIRTTTHRVLSYKSVINFSWIVGWYLRFAVFRVPWQFDWVHQKPAQGDATPCMQLTGQLLVPMGQTFQRSRCVLITAKYPQRNDLVNHLFIYSLPKDL